MALIVTTKSSLKLRRMLALKNYKYDEKALIKVSVFEHSEVMAATPLIQFWWKMQASDYWLSQVHRGILYVFIVSESLLQL